MRWLEVLIFCIEKSTEWGVVPQETKAFLSVVDHHYAYEFVNGQLWRGGLRFPQSAKYGFLLTFVFFCEMEGSHEIDKDITCILYN